MMECEQYGANVFDVIDLINHEYPRGGIAAPGLTAGACLRKDFAFSEERSSAPGMLLAVSRVHETVPLFLVKGLKRAARRLAARPQGGRARPDLQARLRRRARLALRPSSCACSSASWPRVARHDPNVREGSEPLESALEGADAVVIATNHSAFEGLADRLPAGLLLVDPWNVSGSSQVFAHVRVPASATLMATEPRTQRDEVDVLRARLDALEREQVERTARAHQALAAAQDKSYWLDRWHLDLNALMRSRSRASCGWRSAALQAGLARDRAAARAARPPDRCADAPARPGGPRSRARSRPTCCTRRRSATSSTNGSRARTWRQSTRGSGRPSASCATPPTRPTPSGSRSHWRRTTR